MFSFRLVLINFSSKTNMTVRGPVLGPTQVSLYYRRPKGKIVSIETQLIGLDKGSLISFGATNGVIYKKPIKFLAATTPRTKLIKVEE